MNQVCTPPAPPAQEAPRYASTDEAQAAIHQLSDLESKRLRLIAYAHCHVCGIPFSCMEPLDLLHEAVSCTLDGRKRWRHGVSMVYHLDRAMENIAGHARRRLNRQVEAAGVCSEDGEEMDDPLDQMRDLRRYPQEVAAREAAHERARAAFLLFSDDPPACTVLRHRAEGLDKMEIQARMQLSDTAYDTISKRILRKLTSHYDEPRSAGR